MKKLENIKKNLENKNKISSLGHEKNILLQMIGDNILPCEYLENR